MTDAFQKEALRLAEEAAERQYPEDDKNGSVQLRAEHAHGYYDGYLAAATAREKEIEELRAKLASMREPIWMLREEHEREIEELRAELADWRESARKASGERCEDEIHCCCVPYLRVEIETLRARESRWVEEEEYERLFKSGQWKSVELAYRGRRLWLMAFVPPIPLPGEGG